MSSVFFKKNLVILIVAYMGMAHADSYYEYGCKIESQRNASLRWVETRNEIIDGISTKVWRFEATARGNRHFTFHGWQHDIGFLMDIPYVSIYQKYQQDWRHVNLFIGSFLSAGGSTRQVSNKNSLQIWIRASEGRPVGRHKMRVIVSTEDGRCIASTPFYFEVQNQPPDAAVSAIPNAIPVDLNTIK